LSERLKGDETRDRKAKEKIHEIAFLPLGVWSTALGWKRFLGVAVEGQPEQGVVV